MGVEAVAARLPAQSFESIIDDVATRAQDAISKGAGYTRSLDKFPEADFKDRSQWSQMAMGAFARGGETMRSLAFTLGRAYPGETELIASIRTGAENLKHASGSTEPAGKYAADNLRIAEVAAEKVTLVRELVDAS